MVNGNLKKQTTRISVTISTELYEVLKELGSITGKSAAHMPAYVLEESKPTFEALIKAYTTAKTSKQQALDDIKVHAEAKMVHVAGVISND